MSHTQIESQIKQLIVESLMLEDVTAEQIGTHDPLFVSGLGLDSIDALELAIAIEKKFGIRIKPDDENTRKVFANVASLAEFVVAQRDQKSNAAPLS